MSDGRVSDGSPVRKRVPSNGTTGRRPLFAGGYCDVMPITAEQLNTQRAYINGNPRSRLLRTSQRATLMPCRGALVSALTPSALRGYLQRECLPKHATPEALNEIERRLLLAATVPSVSPAHSVPSVSPAPRVPSGSPAGNSKPFIALDTYGNRQLLNSRLLPVVCHYRDKSRFNEQKARCLEEAARGTVLVSARIAPGEQEIMNEAMNHGSPVIIIADNGFPERYHPSMERIDRCAEGKLLIVTPWQYQYRGKNEQLTIPFCKAMNCVAQALCRQKDDWWKHPAPRVPSGSPAPRVSSGSPAPRVPSVSPAPRVSSVSPAPRVSSGSPAGNSKPFIALDTYGNRQLLNSRLLPVVCHYRDKSRFNEQKARCLEEAARGTVLVSARIAPGEQEIMNEAMNHGSPVIIIADNGFPERYHPSMERIDRCAEGKLLIVTPWQYQYRGKNEQLTIPFCKAMNCVAQALCRQKDDWWKHPAPRVPSGSPAPRVSSGSPVPRVLSGSPADKNE